MIWGISKAVLLSAACLAAHGHVLKHNATNSNGSKLWSNVTYGASHQLFAADHSDNADNEVSDRHGKERELYHLTHWMAQRGRDLILSRYPEFAQQCSNDTDCRLSLIGIPDSVSHMVLEVKPAQRGEDFSDADFWEHASWKGAKAERDSAHRTLILKEGMSASDPAQLDRRLENLHKSVAKDDDLFTYFKVLEEKSQSDEHTVHGDDIKKAMRKVNEDRPMNDLPSLTMLKAKLDHNDQAEATSETAGTLFLRSLISHGVCHGDAYLCDRPDQDLSELPILKLPRIGTMKGVLTDHNYLKIALVESFQPPGEYNKFPKWPYKERKHHGKGPAVEKAIQKAVKETRAAVQAQFLVNPLLRYTMEVFDPTTGQLTPATVMPYKDDPPSRLKAIGYLRYFSPDARTNGTKVHYYSRLLHDMTPIVAGSGMLIPVDTIGLPPGKTTTRRPSANNSSSLPGTNSTGAWMNGGIPDSMDIRLIQAMKNYKGDVKVDSMGQPKLRSISVAPALAQMMAIDSVSLEDRASMFKSRIAVRPLRPDGTVFRRYDGLEMSFEFIPGKSADVNAISVPRQAVRFHGEPGNVLQRTASEHILKQHRIVERNFARLRAGHYSLSSRGAGSSPSSNAKRQQPIKWVPGDAIQHWIVDVWAETWRGAAMNFYPSLPYAPPAIPGSYFATAGSGSIASLDSAALRAGSSVGLRVGMAGSGNAVNILTEGGGTIYLVPQETAEQSVLLFQAGGTTMEALVDASSGVPEVLAMAPEAFGLGAEGASGGAIAAAEGAAEGAAVAGGSAVACVVGGVAVVIALAVYAIMLGMQFAPDHTCPMRERYTEMWNPEIATATWATAPCETTTTAMWVPLTTSTSSATVSGASSATTPSAGIPLYTNGTVLTYTTTIGVIPSALPSPASQKPEPPCETPSLPPGFAYKQVADLRCAVPMADECTNEWFHEHVNDLPAGRRNPNYCHNGDLLGHEKAAEMKCLPDFESKKCKKEFHLNHMSYEEYQKMREDREDGAPGEEAESTGEEDESG